MAENSKIEWTDHTFNPWVGCVKISPACDHCYAEGWARRTGNADLWNGQRRRTTDSNWKQPMKWNRQAEATGVRFKVFCSSLADVFDNQVPDEWRDDLWRLIAETPHLDWLLLTKRPQNIHKMLPRGWGDTGWPNVCLGTSTENQKRLEENARALAQIPARLRFLSCEPLLEQLDLNFDVWTYANIEELGGPGSELIPLLKAFKWVIVGGESGPGARPMHPTWARSLRDQCQAAGVPFFMKQWGEHLIAERRAYPDLPDDFFLTYQDGHEEHGWTEHDDIVFGVAEDHRGEPKHIYGHHWASGTGHMTRRVGKKKAGALLDDREWREMPA